MADLLRAFGEIVTHVVVGDGLFNTPVGLASDPIRKPASNGGDRARFAE